MNNSIKYLITFLVCLLSSNILNAQTDSLPLIPNDSLKTKVLENNKIEFSEDTKKKNRIYKLRPIVDVPVVSIGVGWSAFAFSQIYSKNASTEEEIRNLKRSNIPTFDRWAAGKSDPKADANSDYLFYGTIPVPFLLLLDKGVRSDAAKIGFLYLEAMAITGLFYSGSVYFVDRYRPETYDTLIPVNERTTGNNKDAFLAGHPALVATGMFFTAKVYADYHPESKFKYVLYGAAIAATGTTVYLRHIAGKHFPSDLLAGVTLGTLSGILVPQLHKRKDIKEHKLSFAPFMNGNKNGITMILSLN